MNDSLDLEMLVQKRSVPDQVSETFDLLCPKVFEILVFCELNPKGTNIKDFQMLSFPDFQPLPTQFANPDRALSQHTQGSNTSTRGTLAVDFLEGQSCNSCQLTSPQWRDTCMGVGKGMILQQDSEAHWELM